MSELDLIKLNCEIAEDYCIGAAEATQEMVRLVLEIERNMTILKLILTHSDN